MGSLTGFNAGLELDELQAPVDRGSGAISVGTRFTNALTNLGQQTLVNDGAVVALTNNISTAQDIFAAGKVLTLQANTTYVFEAQLLIQTGTTSHTDAIGFVVSTALAFIEYTANVAYNVLGALSGGSPTIIDVATASATVVTTAQTTNTLQSIELLGTFKTGNATTTMRPQVTFSAGPTGTCQTLRGSYLAVWPIVSQ